jgi:hypothetical protein
MLLANMEFDWLDASALFVLWVLQFSVPHLREEIATAYGVWMVILVIVFVGRRKPVLAWTYFWETVRTSGRPDDPTAGP